MAIDLDKLPPYRQLPVKMGAPERSAWGLFGDDDQLGCLNLITPEKTREAAKLVRNGAVFPLNLRLDEPSPPMYGRQPVKHSLIDLGGGVARDDYLDSFWPQASSQWDGFRHIRHPRDGFYNGVKDDEVVTGDRGKLGMENFARKGIATRGVLADLERYLKAQGAPLDMNSSRMVGAAEVQACLRAQEVAVKPGDIILFNFGWLRWYLSEATDEERERLGGDAMAGSVRYPGLGPADELVEYLWDLHVAAAAADNPGLDAWPPTPEHGWMHFHLLPLLGIPIGELWYMQELADDCAADGVYEFMLTSAPLHMPGGVGSPPNALAIK
jgi:kynurenine formamidase